MSAKVKQIWKKFPIFRTLLTVSISSSIGDFLCQNIEHKSLQHWDKERTKRMGFIGLCVSGPINHMIIFGLEKFLPGISMRAIFGKILLNTLLAPISIISVFTANTLLCGKTLNDAMIKVKKDLPPTYLVGMGYWPTVNFFIFRFVHLYYRPLCGSLAGVMWNIFMSNRANKMDHLHLLDDQ